MKPKIKFSHNWNNKLQCEIFTTIRTSKSIQYYLDNLLRDFDIILNNKKFGEAILINVDNRKFMECDEYLTLLDTGVVNIPERYKLFEKFGIKMKTDIIILKFKRVGDFTSVSPTSSIQKIVNPN